jgi:formylglycine-generating enzyme required for sulfatase activity
MATFPAIPFMEMVPVSGGTFTMGSPASEPDRSSDETQHSVTLSSFSIGKYEVMQGQYQAVMGANPSHFKTATNGENPARRPVECVSWYDAVEFCNRLSAREGLSPAYSISGSTNPAAWGEMPTSTTHANYATWNAAQIVPGSTGYRLPTEAQWEYACRAGTATPFNFHNGTSWGTSQITTDQANFNGSPAGVYRQRTIPVGSFAPNAWGLYDMHGNVWEWCWDWYGSLSNAAQTDPAGAVSGVIRVVRGGSWDNPGQNLRSAYRNSYSYPDYRYRVVGFRLVRPAV